MTTQPPPGTGGTTRETTLVDELEESAVVWSLMAFQAERAGDNPIIVQWRRDFASRLRARAARVRELLDLAHAQKFDGGRRELARALTGPLPAATPAETKP